MDNGAEALTSLGDMVVLGVLHLPQTQQKEQVKSWSTF